MFITKSNFSFLICFLVSFVVSSQKDTTSGWKIYTYPSGKQSSTGKIKNGLPVGKWINYFESGQIRSVGNWSPNGLDSTWLFYSKEGQIERSISYANNLKNGRYLVYDSLASIKFDGFYVNDTLQGPFKRYKDGLLIEEGKYIGGKLDGVVSEYDAESGRLISIKNFAAGKEEEENRINRIINGKREGLWQTYDKKGKLLSQERYSNGILVKDDSDPTVSFDFENEFHANGQLKSEYAIVDGKKNGVQSNFSETGEKLVSQLYDKDVLLAEGWFSREGEKDSVWQYFYPKGTLLSKGKYKDGKEDGMWIYYFENSKRVEQKGVYKNGLPAGRWTWYYPNGQIRRTEGFYKGRYDGEIIDYDSTGNVIQKQTYVYNERDGDYFYFIGDHQEKGKMQNGLRQGRWVFNYANGKKAFVGKYKDGLPNGKHKFWFDNGKRQLIIGYKSGKFHGKKYEFNKRGGLIHTYYYKNGKLISIDDININEDRIQMD